MAWRRGLFASIALGLVAMVASRQSENILSGQSSFPELPVPFLIFATGALAMGLSANSDLGAVADLRWAVVMICSMLGVTCLSFNAIYSCDAILIPAWPSWSAIMFPLGLTMVAIALDEVLPGATYTGPVTKRGHVPVYKDNAVKHCLAINAIFFAGIYAGLWPATIVVDDFPAVISSLNLFGLAFCAWLYHKGLYRPDCPDAGASGKGFFHDIFWGVILYPRCFGKDVKRIFNCRFSMTFWMLHGISCIATNYEKFGELDPAVVFSAVSQWIYLFKFFWWEAGYMHSIDIILDNAGFYETWGVLVYVPALYTVHTRALCQTQSGMSWPVAGAIFAFSLVAILCNYLPDRQRCYFRHDKNAHPSTYIEATYTVVDDKGESSTRTTRLLCSGWWGWSRHPQYVFELATAWSWALLGCPWQNSGISCLYALFLTCLLIQRTGRDEEKCSAKYGKFFVEYKKRVPWRMVPGVW